MKKIFFILFITALISCGKMPINGNLDGRWQLMTIDCHENGEQTYPEYTYYDVSLHLMEQKRKTANNETSLFFGLKARFQHIDDSLHIQMIRCTKKSVIPFGMNDTIQHFAVETLTKKKMILNSGYARLSFRKF